TATSPSAAKTIVTAGNRGSGWVSAQRRAEPTTAPPRAATSALIRRSATGMPSYVVVIGSPPPAAVTCRSRARVGHSPAVGPLCRVGPHSVQDAPPSCGCAEGARTAEVGGLWGVLPVGHDRAVRLPVACVLREQRPLPVDEPLDPHLEHGRVNRDVAADP